MRTRRTSLRMSTAMAVVASLSVMAACGSDDDDGGAGSDTTAVSSSETSIASDTTVVADTVPGDTVVDIEGVEAEKVILASVLLAVGDVDVALAEGLVTADEVDLAAEALESGTLDAWMQRAEAGD